MKNEIRENSIGIEINSGDPYILNNVIEKNYNSGIHAKCVDDIRSDGKVRNNEILGNFENGIEASGNKNFLRIESNTIMYNLKAGVRSEQEADIVIFQNQIGKNLTQGILLVESSQACIEKNNIFENIKS